MREAADHHRSLCLDGGGSKGFYTLGVLHEMEQRHGKLHEIFQSVYGTSTGSIIASLIASGHSVGEVKKIYEESISDIMTKWTSKGRSKALEARASVVFKDIDFKDCKIPLGIVATNFNDRKPLIFKSHKRQAHAGVDVDFVPGRGCKLQDAVIASCSAYPFFVMKGIKTSHLGDVLAMDGGFSANNPSLISYLDLIKAWELPEEKISIMSIGVGEYQASRSLRFASLAHLAPAKDLAEAQFHATLGLVEAVFSLISKKSKYLRVSSSAAETGIACSLIESNPRVLNSLFELGRRAYGVKEGQVSVFFNA